MSSNSWATTFVCYSINNLLISMLYHFIQETLRREMCYFVSHFYRRRLQICTHNLIHGSFCMLYSIWFLRKRNDRLSKRERNVILRHANINDVIIFVLKYLNLFCFTDCSFTILFHLSFCMFYSGFVLIFVFVLAE